MQFCNPCCQAPPSWWSLPGGTSCHLARQPEKQWELATGQERVEVVARGCISLPADALDLHLPLMPACRRWLLAELGCRLCLPLWSPPRKPALHDCAQEPHSEYNLLKPTATLAYFVGCTLCSVHLSCTTELGSFTRPIQARVAVKTHFYWQRVHFTLLYPTLRRFYGWISLWESKYSATDAQTQSKQLKH